MNIAIKVRDFRGAERADIECAPLALLAGRNGAGKTSVAQAVGAALTGAALPFGLAKKDAGALVRAGAGNSATVEISADDDCSHVSMTWPSCESWTEGEVIHASVIAAGSQSFVDMRPDERARYLADLLHTEPTREDFASALADRGITAQPVIDALWKLVTEKGWDGAHAIRKEKGAELKGRWRQVTGQNYGSRIAAAWTPPHWTDDLDATTDRELEAAVADAKDAHRRAMAASGAAAGRREVIEEEAAKLDDCLAAVDAATREMTEANTELEGLIKRRDALPATGTAAAPHTIPCPHCSKPIVASNTLAGIALQKPPSAPAPEDPSALKQLRLLRAEIEGRISNLELRAAEAKRRLTAAQTALEIARKARAELGNLPEAESAADATDQNAAEAAVTRAEQRLAAWKAKTEADAIRDRIAGNDLAIDVLAADGLRARKLARVLDVFNDAQIAPLCAIAGWKPVAIGPDMAVTYHGRDYRLLSASEQYRCRVALQVAVARLDGSAMVVIDAADILDAPTRGGLFRLLTEAGIPALVCLTLSKESQVPSLQAAGLGKSYWIETGIAREVGAIEVPNAA